MQPKTTSLLPMAVPSLWLAALLMLQCSSATAGSVLFRQYRTSVTPQAGETLQDRCYYQLLLPVAERRVRSVFVIFERGWQIGNLYYDPVMVDFAASHQIGLLLAQHCRSKEREDMDVMPEHGIGRALFTALRQFASDSHHPELDQSDLIFFSFSGGGSLVARMAGFAPGRTLAVIAYAPGQYEPLGMDTIDLPKQAFNVPQLIIANGRRQNQWHDAALHLFSEISEAGRSVYLCYSEQDTALLRNECDLTGIALGRCSHPRTATNIKPVPVTCD